MYFSILSVLFLSLIALSLGDISYAESEIMCINCVQIPSYELDLYKEMFPLTVWTDSQIYDHYSTITVNGYLKPQNTVAPILVVVTNPIGNVVTVQQLSSDVDGNFSFELNTGGPLWLKNGDYILKVQSGTETRQFKTKFTLVPTLIGIVDKCASNEISVLANNGHIYCIQFQVTNGIVTGTTGKLNSDTKTITLDIRGHDIDSISFGITRSVLDSKSVAGSDSDFIVMADGKMAQYQEFESTSDYRQIKLDHSIDDQTTIEIIGTNIVPEFGSISLLILIGSITSILIISKSFSNRFVKL